MIDDVGGPFPRPLPESPGAVPPETALRVVTESRTYLDEAGSACIEFAWGEPILERLHNAVRARHVSRLLRIAGDLSAFWATMRLFDGERSMESVVQGLEVTQRPCARQLIDDMVRAGAMRPTNACRKTPHEMTKHGTFEAGGLTDDENLRLMADGGYRSYPGSPRLTLERAVPQPLTALSDVMEARRSTRLFSSAPIDRAKLAAALAVSCGCTGSIRWDRTPPVNLRAHPSGGALYAVEVYVLVFSVTGLSKGLYHYLSDGHILEYVLGEEVCDRVLDAALPSERGMLGQVAAMVCLTGNFPRHQQKYGVGGYRMLAAEAGHISQNILLCATALGLSARPFGGLFDDLFNQACAFENGVEEYLLSVLLGPTRQL